jgi:GNAT superfamily N-acetyltransferase
MPDPVPVMVLGRLAVEMVWQGRWLGSSLLGDAIRRTTAAASIAGMRALMVHATDEKAGAFYEKSGLTPSKRRPLTYFLLLHPLSLDR